MHRRDLKLSIEAAMLRNRCATWILPLSNFAARIGSIANAQIAGPVCGHVNITIVRPDRRSVN